MIFNSIKFFLSELYNLNHAKFLPGHNVVRRFGWDCHGLPVEYEIDKQHNITGPEDVEKMGIAKYNELCRGIVMRYSGEWERVVKRVGRWIDFEHDYKTMYPWFMESVWWVFSELFKKGFVYRGFKVMPYSTACNTPLSNFEANLNYKDVNDPAVIVSFPLANEPDVSFLAWTTTPWTLPSNLALCVNPKQTYVKVKELSSGKVYIMMKNCLKALFKTEDLYQILEEIVGKKLEGTKYVPLFDYFKSFEASGAFKVVVDDYVSDEAGVGIVHQAPYFGEDDYRICLSYGIIKKGEDAVCPVDASGKFSSVVTHFAGQYVKDADSNICKHLKSVGRLVHQSQISHSYPFCWRSNTPLLYRAIPCWFIKVEQIVDKLLKSNEQTYWVPDQVKEGRFANWVSNARDWAISRNRYWGNPMPIWTNSDFSEVRCISSIAELEELSGQKITDIHRESIDHLEIPSCKPNGEPLKRISEVFDCWFESGSMPYAQQHYPFEHKKDFEENFPADFIAEGLDQTRGWFYTLLIVSTALFNKPPFKNLICNGLILAENGEKMSKSKKNYPDPEIIVNNYGADALRLYLINSPVVRAEELKFREDGVKSVLKEVFIPWFNAYRFLVQNVENLKCEHGIEFTFNETSLDNVTNYMDKWILSSTQSLIEFVNDEMQAYRLYTVVPKLVKFIDTLTNWYVRMNRRRIRGQDGLDECMSSLTTLFSTLFDMVRFMAPFIPFLTEYMYQNLKNLLEDSAKLGPDLRSVHFLSMPKPTNALINVAIEKAVSRMQTVVEMGRLVRDRKTLPIKYPLSEVIVIHSDSECLKDVESLSKYIKEELNVKSLETSSDKQKYKISYKALPNLKLLGTKLKKDMKNVTDEIKKLSDSQLMNLKESGKIEVCGYELTEEELLVKLQFDESVKEEFARYEALSSDDFLILLDITPSEEMKEEGIAREMVNRIQKLRKAGKLNPYDEISVHIEVDPGSKLAKIVENNFELIVSSVKQPTFLSPPSGGSNIICSESFDLHDSKFIATICRPNESSQESSTGAKLMYPSSKPNGVGFVNVKVASLKFLEGKECTLLMENPIGTKHSTDVVLKQIETVLNLRGMNYCVYTDAELTKELKSGNISNGQMLFVKIEGSSLGSESELSVDNSGNPLCNFVNVVNGSQRGAILLENPKGRWLKKTSLPKFAQCLFKLPKEPIVFLDDKKARSLDSMSLNDLCGETLYV